MNREASLLAARARIALLEYRVNQFRLRILEARREDTRQMYTEICRREEGELTAALHQIERLEGAVTVPAITNGAGIMNAHGEGTT